MLSGPAGLLYRCCGGFLLGAYCGFSGFADAFEVRLGGGSGSGGCLYLGRTYDLDGEDEHGIVGQSELRLVALEHLGGGDGDISLLAYLHQVDGGGEGGLAESLTYGHLVGHRETLYRLAVGCLYRSLDLHNLTGFELGAGAGFHYLRQRSALYLLESLRSEFVEVAESGLGVLLVILEGIFLVTVLDITHRLGGVD